MFRMRRGKRGVAIRLHDLEAEVMDVIWSRNLEEFAVSDVLQVLEQRRDIAYTTVMTTLARLHEKNLLARKKVGKRHLYDAKLSREEFLQETVREVLEGIGESAAGRESLALLVETVSAADQSGLDELEHLIRLRRKELGR